MFNKFLKTSLFIQVTMVSFLATLAAIGLVAAATTIGTDISTGGTLTVTGTTATSTFSTGGFTVGTSQFVVQSSSGNVGIGTTSPLTKLSIQGTAGANDVLNVASSTGASMLYVNAAGNVGIGTTAPNNLLSVYQLIDFNNTDFNTKLGYQAGLNIVSGASDNTFIGYQAGMASSTASTNAMVNNTAVGYQSLYSNTTGGGNVANGMQSLYSNTTGSYNTAIGRQSLYYNTTGSNNAANGQGSLSYNTTGSYNTANGQSLFKNTTGSYNTANGYYSLYYNTTGSYNTAIGYYSLFNTTGASSTAIGSGAGYSNTTGSHNIIIGFNTDLPAVSSSNMLSIGNLIYATGLTAFTDHSSSVSAGNVGIGTSSPWGKLSVQASDNGSIPQFIVASSTATSFIVDKSGNVGIGTTTPVGKLHVRGITYIGPVTLGFGPTSEGALVLSGDYPELNIFEKNATVLTGLAGNRYFLQNIVGGTFSIVTDVTGAILTLTKTGNVGIGTTTPNWLLQVSGTRPSLALSDYSAAANLKHWLFSSMGGNLYIGTSTDAYATSTPPALTILNNGNVGIATTTFNGNLGIGPLTANASSTISGGKLQWDGYNSAGTRYCWYFVGTNLTATAGACNP